MGLLKYLINIIPIRITDLYNTLTNFTIRPTIVKSIIIVEMISQRRNYDIDSNDIITPQGIITDEWKELKDLSPSKFMFSFFFFFLININK